MTPSSCQAHVNGPVKGPKAQVQIVSRAHYQAYLLRQWELMSDARWRQEVQLSLKVGADGPTHLEVPKAMGYFISH